MRTNNLKYILSLLKNVRSVKVKIIYNNLPIDNLYDNQSAWNFIFYPTKNTCYI